MRLQKLLPMSQTILALTIPLLVTGCSGDSETGTQGENTSTASNAAPGTGGSNAGKAAGNSSGSSEESRPARPAKLPEKTPEPSTDSVPPSDEKQPVAAAPKPVAKPTPVVPAPEPSTTAPPDPPVANASAVPKPTSPTLEEKIATLQIPPPWLKSVTTRWDTNKPWKEARIEIRRLLGMNQEARRREAIMLMWHYHSKDDMGNHHEYPMYTHLGKEPIWAVVAYREFLGMEQQKEVPLYGLAGLGALYIQLGEFELARASLEKAMQHLPGPPWHTMRKADINNGLGDLYVAWGDKDKARKYYGEAIRLYPTARPPYGGHLLPRRAKKVQSKLELLSFRSLADARLKDGRYQDKALGYSGDINLTVTVTRGRVAKVDVRHQEKIDQNACVLIPKAIVAEQSLDVDGITGATVTKDAIVGGTYRALKQAGLK